MRILLFAIMLGAAFVASAETWRWVDENGQVHYSDRYVEGAERVELTGAQTYSAPQPARRAADTRTAAEPAAEESTFRYRGLTVTEPEQDQVFWNVGGQVPVRLDLQPNLQSGHLVRVYLDGEMLANLPRRSTSFQLSDVYRGTHTVRAEVTDAEGTVLQQSPTVTFHVQQTSIRN